MVDVNPAKKSEDSLVIDKRNIPYTMDGGLGERARIGLIVLATDQTIEYEFRTVLNLPGVALYESRLYNAPTITPETLQAMEREIAGATSLILPGVPLDVVAYACTSGAMVIGEATVHARIHEARPEVSCTTPMEATIAAFEALGVHRICLIAPYADEINRRMRSYIQERGFSVPVMGSWNEPDDSKVARISPASIREAVIDLGRADVVEAAFVSCTNLRVVDMVEQIEADLGKPVISSNHALAWHCLRLAGVGDNLPQFGRLFTRPIP
ncbi:MAG: Asp/Glu racemase [Proteobacteria bacterium]|nr:Asp/Glu racemase [Pseudomonadota bacterium]